MSASESETRAGGIGQKAQAAARSAAETIKNRAAETAAQVKEAAADMAEERRHHMADSLGSVGSALHESAESSEKQDPNIAWLTREASSRLQRASEYMRVCSWQQLRDDSADFARRHPVAFFGGMFAIGAAAGALIKAGISSAGTVASDQTESGLPPESEPTTSPGTEEPYAPSPTSYVSSTPSL